MNLIRMLSSAAHKSAWIRNKLLGPTESPVAPKTVPEESDSSSKSISAPTTVPVASPRQFLRRWMIRYSARLIPKSRSGEPAATAMDSLENAQALSIRIAVQINRLERPMLFLSCGFVIWLLCHSLLFALSLMFPLPDYYLTAFDPAVNACGLLLAPMAVGYGTNWLAIKMLFHPKHQNPIWQGLIPAKRDALIESIADGIINRLISPEIVRDYLHNSGIIERFLKHLNHATRSVIDRDDFKLELRRMVVSLLTELAHSPRTRLEVAQLVEAKVREYTGSADFGEMMATVMKGWWGPKLKAQVLKVLPEIPKALDGLLTQMEPLMDNLEQQLIQNQPRLENFLTRACVESLRSLDIKHIVKQQLQSMDQSELENLLTGDVMAELVFIQVMGGIFGLLMGFALLFPPLRLVLIAAFSLASYVIYKSAAIPFTPESATSVPSDSEHETAQD